MDVDLLQTLDKDVQFAFKMYLATNEILSSMGESADEGFNTKVRLLTEELRQCISAFQEGNDFDLTEYEKVYQREKDLVRSGNLPTETKAALSPISTQKVS